MFKDKMNSNIWKLHGFYFFHNLIFAYAIERLFALQRNLTVQQMVYLEILYAVIIIILEVPTGALADRWSRKNMMVLSAVFSFLEFFILIFSYSFGGFALSALCAAMQGAFKSGTGNAIFYDSLKAMGREEDFEKVIGRNNFIDYTACVLAALAGGLLATRFSYVSAYWLSLISEVLSMILVVSLYEPEKCTAVEVENLLYFEHMKGAFKFLKEHKGIKTLILFGVITGAAVNYLDEYWQIYYGEIGIPLAVFGVLSSVNMLIHSGSALFAARLKELIGYRMAVTAVTFGIGALLVSASFTRSFFGTVPVLLISLLYGFVQPLVCGYMHHRTESYHRATVESFQSLVQMLVIALVGLGFGWICTKVSIFLGFRFLGGITIVYGILHIATQDKYLKIQA